MKQKVLILHLAHWDQLMGGAEQQLKYLANYLLNKGYEVHIISLKQNDKPLEKTELISHLIPYRPIPGTFGQTFFRFKRILLKKIKEINPDVFVTRGFTSWAGISAEIAKKYDKKHLHFIASDNEVVRDEKKISKRRFLNKIELKFYLKVYNGHTKIICQNGFQSNTINTKYNIHSEIITQAAPSPHRISSNKTYDVIQIVWIANLKPLKQPEKYIEIVEHFKDNNSIKFLMIGRDLGNKYQHLLQTQCENPNFDYLGELTNDEVNVLLEKSHILINTSEYEGFSNTFVQAWMRKNIVISMNSNPDEILTTYNVGFICPTIEEMKEKINFLLENRTVLNEMQETAVNYVNKEHNLDENLNTITKLLKITENGTTLV